MLASFLGVLPILTPPLCALAFIMDYEKPWEIVICFIAEVNPNRCVVHRACTFVNTCGTRLAGYCCY
jgi:hypothetical protein